MLLILPLTLLLFVRLPRYVREKQQIFVRNASALCSITAPSSTQDLSSALHRAYNDKGISGVLSHCYEYKISSTYKPKELVCAALQVPSKGAASGILNAIIGSCCGYYGDGGLLSPFSDGEDAVMDHFDLRTVKAVKKRNARTALRIFQEYDDASYVTDLETTRSMTTAATAINTSSTTLTLKPDVVTLALTYTASFHTYPRIANKILFRASRPTLKTSDQQIKSDEHTPAPLQILLDSESFMIINKPSGLVLTTETAATCKPRSKKQMLMNEQSLEEILLAQADNKPIQLSSINPDGSRGFAHRLDRGTSGCLIIAKTNQWHAQLLTQFFLRRVEKSYIALVYTNSIPLPGEGTITVPIDGRPAVSSFVVFERYPGDLITKIRVTTKQGRKHQVRIHCSKGLGAPILLDPLYGGESIMYRLPKDSCAKKYRAQQRFCLHADSLAIADLDIPKVDAPIPDWWDGLCKDIHHLQVN
mmetsp:Transcript_13325/g.31997  ORF Transcript_13325/g.31997 Transcript_13325/m.31997 type:complete len:475 (+) Transcript_13325:28-1452(+)